MTTSVREQRFERLEATPFHKINSSSTLFVGFFRSAREIFQHRELVSLLVGREVKARYKDSVLGFFWSLARPLLMLVIYFVAIGQILGASRSIPDFAIFVFIGLTVWGLFFEIVQAGTTSLTANAGLVKKIFLPREIFPLSSVGVAMFNAAIQFVVLILAIIFFASVPFHFSFDLLLVPLSLASLIAFGFGIALLTSALNVYLRDTQHFVDIVLMLLFWASPIVYSFTFVHQKLNGNWLEILYVSNPVTLAILGIQKALWSAGGSGQAWPDYLETKLLVVLVLSLVLIFVSQRVFARLQGNFAQEL